MDAEAWRSFLSLVAMVAISIGSALALRRWNRESVMALAIGAVYATIIIAWTTIVSFRSLTMMAGPAFPERIASMLFALGIYATIPAAFAIAWPLRHAAVGRSTCPPPEA